MKPFAAGNHPEKRYYIFGVCFCAILLLSGPLISEETCSSDDDCNERIELLINQSRSPQGRLLLSKVAASIAGLTALMKAETVTKSPGLQNKIETAYTSIGESVNAELTRMSSLSRGPIIPDAEIELFKSNVQNMQLLQTAIHAIPAKKQPSVDFGPTEFFKNCPSALDPKISDADKLIGKVRATDANLDDLAMDWSNLKVERNSVKCATEADEAKWQSRMQELNARFSNAPRVYGILAELERLNVAAEKGKALGSITDVRAQLKQYKADEITPFLNSETPYREKVREKLSKLEQKLEDKSSGIENDKVGIAPGMMYLIGFKAGKGKPYISGAYINEFGFVQAKEDLKRISRVFPSFTGYTRPTPNTMCGVTVGFNDGKNNGGAGFAIALGPSWGWRISKTAHFSLFAGVIHDPTIRTYGPVFGEGTPVGLIRPTLAAGGLDPATVLLGRDVPTKTIPGLYGAIGVALNMSLD